MIYTTFNSTALTQQQKQKRSANVAESSRIPFKCLLNYIKIYHLCCAHKKWFNTEQ